MKKQKRATEPSREIAAISTAHEALAQLSPEAQARVLNYVASMLKISAPTQEQEQERHPDRDEATAEAYPNEGGVKRRKGRRQWTRGYQSSGKEMDDPQRPHSAGDLENLQPRR